jgi:hypothetical protein
VQVPLLRIIGSPGMLDWFTALLVMATWPIVVVALLGR